MCLIFKKEKQAPLISREWVKDVWLRNKDGWGIAYNRPSTGRMTIKTGLEFEDFWNTFSSLQRLPIDIVVHMRWATQGEVSLANTHPFLLSERHNIWFMHNGCVDYPEDDGTGLNNFISMENLQDEKEELSYREYYSTREKILSNHRTKEVDEWDGCTGEEHNEWEQSYYGTCSPSYFSGPSDTYLLASRLLTPMLDNMVNANDFIRSEGFAFIMNKIAGGSSNKFTFHDDRGHILFNRHQWTETTTGIPVSNTYAFEMHKKPVFTYGNYVQRKAG